MTTATLGKDFGDCNDTKESVADVFVVIWIPGLEIR